PAALGLQGGVVVAYPLRPQQTRRVMRIVERGVERGEDIGKERFHARFARLAGDQGRGFFPAREEKFAEPREQLAALAKGLRGPLRLRMPRTLDDGRQLLRQSDGKTLANFPRG